MSTPLFNPLALLALAQVLSAPGDLAVSPARQQQVALSFGVGLYQVRDTTLNPTTYGDAAPSAGLHWTLETPRARHTAELRLALLDGLDNQYGPVGISIGALPSLRYGYVRGAWRLPRGGRLRLGGEADADSRIFYLPLWDDSHLYWLTTYALAARAEASWSWRAGQELRIVARAPLVGLSSRPRANRMYKVDDPDRIPQLVHRDMGALHPANHQELTLAAAYDLEVNRWLQAGVEYRLTTLRSDVDGSAPFSLVSHEWLMVARYAR